MPDFSITNSIRFSEDNKEKMVNDEWKKNEFIEEEVDLQLSWKNCLMGARYEYDNPAEFGFNHQEWRKYFLQYSYNNLQLRAGTFSGLFGRGMIFNSYEEKQIGHDSEITGFNVKYESQKLQLNMIQGKLNYEVIPDFNRKLDLELAGISTQGQLFENLYIGASYLNTRTEQKIGFYEIKDSFELNLAEIWFDAYFKDFELFFNIASNNEHLFEKYINVYSGLNYYINKTSITLEYKSYKYGLGDYKTMQNSYRHQRFLPIQNPPTCLKEYTWTILNRYSPQSDFNDDVGFQLEVNQSISDQTSLSLNCSIMSKHLTFENKGQFIPEIERVNKNLLIAPSVKDEYNPYWNIYSELEHYFKNGSMANIGLGYIFNSQYDYKNNTISSEIKATFLPIYFNYMITSKYSVQLTAEMAQLSEESVDYTNSIYTIAVSRMPSFSISMDYEYVSKNVNDSSKKNWLSGTMLFRVNERQLFEISYGEQRGGLVCKNGMCRYMPPVKGWRFNIVLSY